jgi:hypothetical protein
MAFFLRKSVWHVACWRLPVWGNAFRSSAGGLSPEQVKARIAAIVAFLEAIQRRNS